MNRLTLIGLALALVMTGAQAGFYTMGTAQDASAAVAVNASMDFAEQACANAQGVSEPAFLSSLVPVIVPGNGYAGGSGLGQAWHATSYAFCELGL